MKDFIVKNIYDYMRIPMDAHVVVETDLDFMGRFVRPIGCKQEPFTGSFCGNGHTIKNMYIDTKNYPEAGVFGVNEGEITSVNFENLKISGPMTSAYVGAIAGINHGNIYDVHIKSGAMNLRAAKGTCYVGGLVGSNFGELKNDDSAADINAFTTGGKLLAGGFVATGRGGAYETLYVVGEQSYNGDVKVGLVAGKLETCIVLACQAASTMNLLNEEVYTNLTVTAKDVKYDGLSWRDNTNDDRRLTRAQSDYRDKIVHESYRMCTFKWKPDRNMEFVNTNDGEVHHQFFEAGKEQSGPPYTYTFRCIDSMIDAFNEDGTPKPFLSSNGYDGMDLYIGGDCSTHTYWAWSAAANDFDFRVTREMRTTEDHGTVAVPPVDGRLGDFTHHTQNLNGNETIAEGYAHSHKGDAINNNFPTYPVTGGQGHTRVMTHSPVVYRDAYGRLDFLRSHTFTNEQGDGLYLKGTGKIPSQSWRIDRELQFQSLLSTHYIAISTKQILACKSPAETIKYESDAKDDAVVYTGKLSSNFRIKKTMATVTNSKGEVIWHKELYTAMHSFAEITDNELKRNTIKKVDLKDYKPLWNPTKVPAGEYTYTLDVLLSTNKVMRACETKFTMKKKSAKEGK